MTKLLYPTFNKVSKLQGFVKVLTPLFDKVLGRYLVDRGDGTWIPLEDTPAIILGNSNVPSPDYPRMILSFNGFNDSDGAQVESGVAELPNPDYNPDDPYSPKSIDVPYNTKYIRYLVTVRVECGAIDEVYRGIRPSSDSIVSEMLTSFLSDPVRANINTHMSSSLAQTNVAIPQTPLGETEFYDTTSVLLMFHTMTTYYDYQTGVFDAVEVEYELHRGGNKEDPDPDPIKGLIYVTSDGINTPSPH